MKNKVKYIIYFLIGLLIIALDQGTKAIAINKNILVIPNFLNITYTENLGAAFGIGNRKAVLFLNSIIIVGIIILLIVQRKNIKSFIPYMLILSGSLGNLIDRLFRGYVIDFIDINIFNFPNFNIADITITVGIFLLVFLILKKVLEKQNKK